MTEKTISVIEEVTTAEISQTSLEIVAVGQQGPSGPSAIGGKSLPSPENPPTDGDLLKYDSSIQAWVYTQEFDCGTY